MILAYLRMLAHETAGEPYVKAHMVREVRDATGRSRGAVEYKFRNVSAALAALNRPWVPGYKPASNYQHDLLEELVMQLERWS